MSKGANSDPNSMFLNRDGLHFFSLIHMVKLLKQGL